MQRRFVFCGLVSCLLLGAVVGASPAVGQTRIEVRLDSVYAAEGEVVKMPVYLANYLDSLSGISLFFRLDRPGICSLLTTVDTAGTLLSGWPSVDLSHVGGSSYNVSLTALSVSIHGESVPPLAPQAFSLPLCYLDLRVFTDLDTLFDTEAFVDIVPNDLTQFGFATPQGELIGIIPVEVIDTSYYRCLSWEGDQCLTWQQVSFPPYDSIVIGPDTIYVLDTSQVKVLNRGYLGITPWVCGDYNGDQSVNLTDVTMMVNFLFGGGVPPTEVAPVDLASPCEFQINLTDLTLLVNYIFLGGTSLTCCPHK